MLFNSYVFIFIFLPITLIGYYQVARYGRQAAGAWLAFASLAFYAWWNPPFVLFLLGSIGFNFLISLAIGRNANRAGVQTAILILGIAANIGALIYYKYLLPLVEYFDSLGLINLSMDSIILPLGISFYTFTQIGFLIDCKQGVAKERGLLEYILFVTFFPHLIAGPILHHKEMMPQFADPATYRFDIEKFSAGLAIFIIGLAKKVLIADSLITVVNGGFDASATLGITVSWLTALSYSLQIYFDFSGYSDMAIGLAYMFNVRFPLNFNSPYKARSVIDFWQRWHMTLTRYLTLYIYNPIAIGNARRRIARGLPMSPDPSKTPGGFVSMIAIPVLITMLLAGAWHGAGRQFLVFGALHGIYLIINHAWRTFGPADKEPGGALQKYFTIVWQVLLTYVAVVVAQVFFRAASIGQAMELLEGMLGLRGFAGGLASGWQYEYGPILRYLPMFALYFGIVWFLPNAQQLLAKYPVSLAKVQGSRFPWLQWTLNPRWALASGLLAGLAIVDLSQHTEFLYFQF